MRILLVSATDLGGGAAAIARNLHVGYRRRGHGVWMAVGQKRSADDDVLVVPNESCRGRWARACTEAGELLAPLADRGGAAAWLKRTLQIPLARPGRWLENRLGREDFDFPGTRHVLDLQPELPDILHLHNLHGGYFDLRALPWLSRQAPVVATLHDDWMLTGHCAYSFSCERWASGCGQCPDLTIYPTIQRDDTASNWRRKQAIYAQSRIHVVTPSSWLMRRVERSMLAPAIQEARVIPNGVDLTVFQPADRRAARATLGILPDASVIVATANRILQNPFKDYPTMRAAAIRAAERLPGRQVLLIALGQSGPEEHVGPLTIRPVGYQSDVRQVAAHYQAADVYVHAAHADTFPNTVLEALACGRPVVATAIGGIPEQVKGAVIGASRLDLDALNTYDMSEATGSLVPHQDAEAMAEAVVAVLSDPGLRDRLGASAARDSRLRFDMERQVDDHLRWYQDILDRRHGTPADERISFAAGGV